MVLSQAITLIESQNLKHQQKAQQIIEACLPYSGQSVRMGITGTPGVGKSTFIESIGNHIVKEGRKLAVLAIDPTSQVTRGSILGDKTRMPTLSNHQSVFIRPSAARDALGGVARKTRETIILCEAAGYDTIFVETVGVGQSEIAVHAMVDFFLLLLLAGAGDELQGIKRGIVEMADLIAINKADGDNLQPAKRAKRDYRNALHLFPPKPSSWTPSVVICSGLTSMGIENIWQILLKYEQKTRANGHFQRHRHEQAKYWLHESIESALKQRFTQHPTIQKKLPEIEKAILEGKVSSFQGAKLLLDLFLGQE